MISTHRITTTAAVILSLAAAGGLALAMIGLGGALAVSQRRPRGNRQTTPLS